MDIFPGFYQAYLFPTWPENQERIRTSIPVILTPLAFLLVYKPVALGL
jgi:hypothetical protein